MTSTILARTIAAAVFGLGAFMAPVSAFAAAECPCFKHTTMETDCASMPKRSVAKKPYGSLSGFALHCKPETGKGYDYIAVKMSESQFLCAYYTPTVNNPRKTISEDQFRACNAQIGAGSTILKIDD